MSRKVKLFWWVLFVFIVVFGEQKLIASTSDSTFNGMRIETKLHYGFVYPHSSAIQYLLRENIRGGELSMSFSPLTNNPWRNLYRNPRFGIGYNYNDFQNENVLGKAHSVFGYFDSPFYLTDSKFSLNYQIGFGLSLFSQKYNMYENPINMAISSTVNAYISFDIVARYKISKKNEIKTALELSHYSNGKTKSPNLGLNTVTVSAAWLYSIKPDKSKLSAIETVNYKKHIAEVFCNFGGKRDELLNEKVYLISTLVGDYNYAFTPKYAFGGGFDLMFDESLGITKESRRKGEAEKRDYYQAGLHFGFRARYGDLCVVLHGGNYVYATFKKYSSFYSRIGLRYSITDTIILNFTLKAHYAIADYLEIGVGYRFKTSGL